MRRLVLPLLLALLLTACESRLYYWGSSSTPTKYEELAYHNYDEQSPQSVCALVCLYEDMVTHPGGSRKVVPPGIYAEYGYLLLQPSTAEYFMQYASASQRRKFASSDFGALFSERGQEMLQKEIELYPESAKFIGPLLKRVKGGDQ